MQSLSDFSHDFPVSRTSKGYLTRVSTLLKPFGPRQKACFSENRRFAHDTDLGDGVRSAFAVTDEAWCAIEVPKVSCFGRGQSETSVAFIAELAGSRSVSTLRAQVRERRTAARCKDTVRPK